MSSQAPHFSIRGMCFFCLLLGLTSMPTKAGPLEQLICQENGSSYWNVLIIGVTDNCEPRKFAESVSWCPYVKKDLEWVTKDGEADYSIAGSASCFWRNQINMDTCMKGASMAGDNFDSCQKRFDEGYARCEQGRQSTYNILYSKRCQSKDKE